jgi:hypothetical protein
MDVLSEAQRVYDDALSSVTTGPDRWYELMEAVRRLRALMDDRRPKQQAMVARLMAHLLRVLATVEQPPPE